MVSIPVYLASLTARATGVASGYLFSVLIRIIVVLLPVYLASLTARAKGVASG